MKIKDQPLVNLKKIRTTFRPVLRKSNKLVDKNKWPKINKGIYDQIIIQGTILKFDI